MSIKFEPFAPGGDSSGEARVRVSAMKLRAVNNENLGMIDMPAIRIAAVGTIKRHAEVVLRKPPLLVYGGRSQVAAMKLPAMRAYARDIRIDISMDVAFVTIPSTQVHATGVIRRHGESLVVISPKRVFGSDKANVGMTVMPAMRMLAYDLAPVERFAVLLQSPGYMRGSFGAGVAELLSAGTSGAASDGVDTLLTIQAFDRGTARGALGSHLTGRSGAVDAVNAIDRADPIVWLVADAVTNAQDDASLFLDMLLAAADIALVTGAVGSKLEAFVAIAAIAEAYDRADPIITIDAESGAAAVDEAAARHIGLLVHAMSATAAQDEANSTLRMLVIATDAAAVSSDIGSSLEALAAAFDAGHVVASIRIGATTYATYAMTIEGQLVSEYADIAFDSHVLHDGHMYVASESGLFLMEGDDDAGVPINASIRKGLSSLGTQLLKKVPAVYVGYTSDGTLLCKVTTTHNRVKRTNVYKINPIPRGVVGDERFTPSKGLNSVYWDFELSNYEGSDFELDTIKVWRLPLSRRK